MNLIIFALAFSNYTPGQNTLVQKKIKEKTP